MGEGGQGELEACPHVSGRTARPGPGRAVAVGENGPRDAEYALSGNEMFSISELLRIWNNNVFYNAFAFYPICLYFFIFFKVQIRIELL